MNQRHPAADRQLALGTCSFALCFCVWGLISAFAPGFRAELGLTATQTSLLVATPVILGALARIPVGMLTDRFGGRIVLFALCLLSATATVIVPLAHSYEALLGAGFLLGLAGSSFAAGVGFVSKWFPPQAQGTALGVYGMGNAGQSIAVFLGPLAAASLGREAVFQGLALLLLLWSVAFLLLARNAPPAGQGPARRPSLTGLAREPMAWLLAGFYFLTFGGFVAFSIYLPTLLKDDFQLSPADAGFRTAGFVILATLMRPVGGALADRIGGARVLAGVFSSIVPFACLMGWPAILPFSVGALGCAALLGVGNGAVFKLVPQLFPAQTGAVTGLVGAMGGLGGFFPPLLLGIFRDRIGVVWPGFLLLAAASAAMALLNHRLLMPREIELEKLLTPHLRRRADQLRAASWATLATALLCASIVVGSRNLQNYDAALVVYTFAVVFAVWGGVYHYAVWLQKPPTRRYWERSLELIGRFGLPRSTAWIAETAGSHIVAQRFIARRSRLRWWMHFCLFWGCLSAVAITFPLVFGWIHFTSSPDDQLIYVTWLFGFPVSSFEVRTVVSFVLFHGLDFSALLVLAGIALALWRRMREEGALALESLSVDFLPLILLFAISVTGLALTASAMWLRGTLYHFLAILHAIAVIGALLYLPFGKFFHIFQRPAQLGVKLYKRAGEIDGPARCPRCGTGFASRMQIEDVRDVLTQTGFDYRMPNPAGHWQAFCPPCKRKSIALSQLKAKEQAHGETASPR
ncbi:MAG: MFS transporter [Bryobacterales bacterium]|nr:MFS transporter [Bryobacterales bacterium]